MEKLKYHCAYCDMHAGFTLGSHRSTTGDFLFCGRCGEASVVEGSRSTRKPNFDELQSLVENPAYQLMRASFVAADSGANMLVDVARIKLAYDALLTFGDVRIKPETRRMLQAVYAKGLVDAIRAIKKISLNPALTEDQSAAGCEMLEETIEDLHKMSMDYIKGATDAAAR